MSTSPSPCHDSPRFVPALWWQHAELPLASGFEAVAFSALPASPTLAVPLWRFAPVPCITIRLEFSNNGYFAGVVSTGVVLDSAAPRRTVNRRFVGISLVLSESAAAPQPSFRLPKRR